MAHHFNSGHRTGRYGAALAVGWLFLIFAPAVLASTEFVVPLGEARPGSIVEGSDGNLWFIETGRSSIGRLTPGGQLTEFTVPSAATLNDIAAGPDGALWFTDSGASQIGRITITGTITLFPLAPGNYGVDITSSVDGNLWFTENNPSATNLGHLARITTAGTITEFGNFTSPGSITSDPNGNLWFVQNGFPSGVARVSPTGTPLGIFLTFSSPQYVALGPDNHIWVGEERFVGPFNTPQGSIVNLTTDGNIYFQTPWADYAYYGRAAPGPDGNMWFGTEVRVTPSGTLTLTGLAVGAIDIVSGPGGALWVTTNSDQVDEISTTPAVIATYQLSSSNANPTDITSGPDGALWFTDTAPVGYVGRITTSGAVTVFPPSAASSFLSLPGAITTGPDGALWFLEARKGFDRMATDGSLQQFPSIFVTSDASTMSVTTGADGNLWFGNENGVAIMTPQGIVTRQIYLGGRGFPVIRGPDGNVWTAVGSSILSITPSGNVTTYPFFTSSMVFGADGNLWLAGYPIVKLTPGGGSSQLLPPVQPFPQSITAGGDKALWFYGLIPFDPIWAVTINGTWTRVSAHASGFIARMTTGPDGKLWFTEPPNYYFNHSPLIGRISAISGVAFFATGNTVNGTVAKFVDGTPVALASDFTATIDWGDGTTSAGLVSGPQGGPFLVRGNHTYQSKPYEFTVTLHDNVDNADYSVVGDAPLIPGTTTFPPGSCVENTGCGFTLGSFTDADLNAAATLYTITVDWGDGSQDSSSASQCGNEFCVSGGHTYTHIGTYHTKITISDPYGAKLTMAGVDVNVADAPLIGGNGGFPSGSCTEGASCQFTPGVFLDSDPKAAVGLYTVTVDWGDGSTSPGTITAIPCDHCAFFGVSAFHIFAEAGSYNTKILVSDIGGATGNFAGITINVADVPLAAHSTTPASPHGVPFTEVIANFKDANPYAKASDFTASIDWGDTTSSAGTVTANAQHGFDVTGTHTYSASGPHTATVTINDIGGSTATVASTVADDYQIIATGPRLHVRLGKPFTAIVATFTDTDPSPDPSNLSASIDWGDGSTPDSGTLIPLGGGVFNVQGTHTYTKPFGKDVTVQINHTTGSAQAVATSTIRLWPKTVPY